LILGAGLLSSEKKKIFDEGYHEGEGEEGRDEEGEEE
jgi:hypothetical protein